MFRETFTTSSVVSYLNSKFISIMVNTDKEKSLAMQYGVRGLPAIFFLSEKGEIIGNRPGYVTGEQMLEILKIVSPGPEKEKKKK